MNPTTPEFGLSTKSDKINTVPTHNVQARIKRKNNIDCFESGFIFCFTNCKKTPVYEKHYRNMYYNGNDTLDNIEIWLI